VFLGLNFTSSEGSTLYLDALRLSGFEPWKSIDPLKTKGALPSGKGGSFLFCEKLDPKPLGVVRVEFQFKPVKTTLNETFSLEYLSNGQWTEIRKYKINQNDLFYFEQMDLHDDQFDFSAPMSLRLRSDLSQGSLEMKEITIKTRINNTGTGAL